MFYFHYGQYDFWDIYECIKKYYPIGIPKDESGMYLNYPGMKALEAVINFLAVSPVNEYADSILRLCALIEEKFKGYRFVPYYIDAQRIGSLEVGYTDDPSNTIFNALFNDQIDLSAPVTGDETFKSNDWIREDYVETGNRWTSHPPTIKE
jgi:hypothetical protein